MFILLGKWNRQIRSDADTDADTDADADTDTDTNQISFFSPLQCRTEAKHGYSFAKVAHSLSMPEMTPEYKSRLLFPRVSRAQRPRAYLMSFNKKTRRAFIYCRNQTQAFCQSIGSRNNIPIPSMMMADRSSNFHC